MQRAAHAYLQTQVTTTSPGDLLILLYDGAIHFLNKSKEYLAVNDVAQKGIYISKTLDIINELDSTLNLDKGGDLAANLHNLYFFCSSSLVMANLKKDAKKIDEVIKILGGLRSAYAEIVALPEAQLAAQSTASNMRPTGCMPPRAQAGTSPTGGATPAPGASARIRSMHAQNQQHSVEASDDAPGMGQPPLNGSVVALAEQSADGPDIARPAIAPAQTPSVMDASAFQNSPSLARPFSAGVTGAAAVGAQAAKQTSAPAPSPVVGTKASIQPSPVTPELGATQGSWPQAETVQEPPVQQSFGGSAFTRRTSSELYRKFSGQ